MLNLDPAIGLNLKFKINLTGTTYEQLTSWANIEPGDSDVSYQVPAQIVDGVLIVKSPLDNLNIGSNGNIKIKAQHGSNLLEVWSSEYKAVEKVQIILEQIEERKVEQAADVKKSDKKEEVKPVVEKVEAKKPEKAPVKKVAPVLEKKADAKIEAKPEVVKAEKIRKFVDF